MLSIVVSGLEDLAWGSPALRGRPLAPKRTSLIQEAPA